MQLYNIENIPGREFEAIGLVQGSTVQSKHIGRDFMAGLKNIVGGEIKGYTEMLEEAREIAVDRMIREAEIKEADGIVGIRFATSQITDAAAEVIAYGTAVRFK